MTSPRSPLLDPYAFPPSDDVSVRDTHDATGDAGVYLQASSFVYNPPDIQSQTPGSSLHGGANIGGGIPTGHNYEPLTSRRAPRILHAGGWLFEILSLCFAIIPLAVLIAILAVYDAKPTPSWVGGLTLNTVVSIASLTFRFGLMVPIGACISQLAWVGLAHGERPLHDVVLFDWASRSPWGSAALLFRAPKKSRLAVLGAALVLLSLIVGPFFQQSITYFDRSFETEDTSAYASITFSYAGTSGYAREDRLPDGDKIPFNLRNAINTGLLSYGLPSQLQAPYYCPSRADCEWYQVPTLALEMQCVNRNGNYDLECSQDSRNWSETLFPDHCSVHGYLASNTPYDPTRTLGIKATLRNASSLDESYWDLPPKTGKRSVDVAFLNVEWFVARQLAKSTSSRALNYVSQASRVEGRQCIIYSVVANIQPRVENGTYSEIFYNTFMPYVTERAVTPAEKPQRLIYETQQACGIIDKTQGCTPAQLSMGVDDYTDLLTAISEPLGGGQLLQRNASSGSNQEVLRFFEGSSQSSNQTWQPPRRTRKESLYSTPNVTSSIEQTLYNTVLQINAAIRSNDTFLESQLSDEEKQRRQIATSHRIVGTVIIDKAHIKVRWPWLAFPAFLIIGAVILLWSTIIECEFDGVPLWKDDPLAILMHTDWRRPQGSRVLKTTGDLAEASRALKAGYIGNVHAEEVVIVIAVNEQDQGDIEMTPAPTTRMTDRTRRRIVPWRKGHKHRFTGERYFMADNYDVYIYPAFPHVECFS